MKRILFVVLGTVGLLSAVQAQQLTTVQGTIVNTSPSRVSVYAKPAAALSSRLFRNVIISISIVDQGGGNPTVTLDSNFIPNLQWDAAAVQVYNGRAYYIFSGTENAAAPTPTSWTTSHNKVATFLFSNANGFNTIQMNDENPTGGPPPNFNFLWYVEIINTGNGDITDYNAKFYGNNPLPTNNLNNPSSVGAQPISILPVIFKDFNVAKQGTGDALLTWTTSMEQNTSHFVLERSIDQGNVWGKFAEVKAKGNSNTPTKYSFTDAKVYDGREASKMVFYRIRSVDIDSRESLFPVRSIRFSATGNKTIGIYPNPAKDGFYLTIPLISQEDRPIKLNLVNRLGQLIHTREISSTLASNYYYDIKTPGVVSGEYMLQIIYNGDLLETKKVIVQR